MEERSSIDFYPQRPQNLDFKKIDDKELDYIFVWCHEGKYFVNNRIGDLLWKKFKNSIKLLKIW